MTTYKHINKLTKKELIRIVKDCDSQITYLTNQLKKAGVKWY